MRIVNYSLDEFMAVCWIKDAVRHLYVFYLLNSAAHLVRVQLLVVLLDKIAVNGRRAEYNVFSECDSRMAEQELVELGHEFDVVKGVDFVKHNHIELH